MNRSISISVEHSCNNRCRFCSQADLPVAGAGRDVLERLAKARAEGLSGVDFVGGEPTLGEGLAGWVEAARKLGFERIGLQTNGRRLAYRSYTAALAAAGLTHVDVSLHGPTIAVHEFHTSVPGSFRQTVTGLRRAGEAGLGLAVTTAVTRSNLHCLDALARTLAALGVANWRLMLVQSVGRAAVDARRIVPRWETAGRHLKEAAKIAAVGSCRIAVAGLPPCIEPELPRRHCDDSVTGAFASPCDACSFRRNCPGIDPGYLALYGDGELLPFSGERAEGGRDDGETPFVGGLGLAGLV